MALAGKSTIVQISVDNAIWYVVSQINDVDTPLDADNIDTTVFGDTFISRIQGLKDATYSLSGFFDDLDTNGQVAIRLAWLNDTALYVKVTYGTLAFSQKVLVSKFDTSTSVDGAVEVSIDLDGTGVASVV